MNNYFLDWRILTRYPRSKSPRNWRSDHRKTWKNASEYNWAIARALYGINVCPANGYLLNFNLQNTLQDNFGKQKGEKLYSYARGKDNTPFKTKHACAALMFQFRNWQFCQERKSIGTQISWGVRFDDMQQVFLLFIPLKTHFDLRLRNSCLT